MGDLFLSRKFFRLSPPDSQPGPRNRLQPESNRINEVKTIRQALEQAVKVHQNGDLEKASHLYDKILLSYPRHPEALHLKGVIAYQKNDPQLAEQLILEAIAINPEAAAYYYNLGEACRAQRRYHKAGKAYLECIKRQPDYPNIYRRLGLLQHHCGKLDEAFSSYRKALRQNQTDPVTLNNFGLLLLDLNKPEQAREAFSQALCINPQYGEACHNLAITFTQQNLHKQALTCYRRTLNLAPDLPGVRRHYIRLLQNLCAWPEFEETLAELTRLTKHKQPLEESPFLNLTYNDNPEQNLRIAEKWCKKMVDEISIELNDYA